jgi:hypothetical protein
VTPVAEACADLQAVLPLAQALLHLPDHDGTTTRPEPASRPPWNSAAANALTTAVQAAADLEASWRSGHRRPYAATGAVLASIVRLSYARDEGEQHAAAVLLTGVITPIEQLAAVDRTEKPQYPQVPCPRCDRRMLRFWKRARILTCWGCMRKADITEGQVSGEPMLVWDDNFVQVAPVLDREEVGGECL